MSISITLEEIKRCLELTQKSEDCHELLYGSAEDYLQNIIDHKINNWSDYHAKQLLSHSTLLEVKQSELNNINSKLLTVNDSFKDKKVIVDNLKSEKSGHQILYNKALQEKESVERHLQESLMIEANQEHNVFNVVAKGTIWEKRNDLSDLKKAEKDIVSGHEEGNSNLRIAGPKECAWGASPAINKICIQALKDKISAWDKYISYKDDTVRAKEKVTEAIKKLNTAKALLDSKMNELDRAEKDLNNIKDLRSELEKQLSANAMGIKQLNIEITDLEKLKARVVEDQEMEGTAHILLAGLDDYIMEEAEKFAMEVQKADEQVPDNHYDYHKEL